MAMLFTASASSVSSAVRNPHSLLRRRSFTLIEVMLALFIGLIVLYGMNRVFSDTATAVRAGQALGLATRNSRAVQPLLFNDFANCAQDSPAFIISSCIVPQYLNATDAKAAAPLPTSGCILGDHMHRADMVMFFARGLYKRKTADNPFLTSTTTSNEAYIHLGHLRVAADGVTPIGPDDYAGAAEPYASDWVLGRNAILLADPVAVVGNDVNLSGHFEDYYSSASGLAPFNNNAAAAVAPLGYGSQDAEGISQVQSSRLDLAGTTIDLYRGTITNASSFSNPAYTWWGPLVYQQPFGIILGAVNPYPAITQVQAATQLSLPVANGATLGSPPPNPGTAPYYSSTNPPTIPTPFFRNRFQASNVLSSMPMTSQDQASLSPYMLEHVSQFIVEYAGDFTTQDANGNVTDTVPDGQIDWVYATKGDWDQYHSYSIGDFVIDTSGNYWKAVEQPIVGTQPSSPIWQEFAPGAAAQANVPKQIRWYGMPRDSSGSGHVYSSNKFSLPLSFPTHTVHEMNNVVPLLDVWLTSTNNSGRPLPYEVETGPTLSYQQMLAGWQAITDYASTSTTNPGISIAARYTAVWRNDVPSLVRILIKIDDPANALQDGPWSEYIFKLK